MSLEENPLLTLPRPIVDALFENAKKEALRAKARILELEDKVRKFRERLKFKLISGSKSGCIAVADGSMSLAPSRRIGSSFAIYTAGFMVFEGDKLIDEKYFAGSLSWSYGGTRQFKTLLRLLMANAERDAALEAYWKYSPDVILLDGPFFFFRSYCRYIKGLDIRNFEYETGLDLIKSVRDKTLTLIRSGRAICIIRRSVLRAIDGWLIYNKGEGARIGTSDKHILTMIMPQMSVWCYKNLGIDPILYSTFYRFYRHYKEIGHTDEDLAKIKDLLLAQSETDLENKFSKDLDMSLHDVPQLERSYIRFTLNAPPFEVEMPQRIDIDSLIQYFTNLFNPATGLPYPIDLIDEAVTLPYGSTTSFTEEVEARLIKDHEIRNKAAISDYFATLNPQKREFV